MSIEEQISELIDKYKGLDIRHLKRFNEENTKKDFILPLFRHLGWDVTNSDEVAAEEKSSNGRVDYAFKIGGVSKFYLEAKPLREDLAQRPDWAKQVITYAENKGVTWAVLTNFKQLMVFNAEWDEPALERARFLNLTYQEYLPAFHKLWWLSRDSVEKGMLDEEARQVGALKPKLPVEKSLLDQLLRWRKELFNKIYQYNRDRGLDFLQVDELIQQFINRLIFIRSTEDRGIEENRLRATLHQWRDSGRKGELVESMRAIFHEFATLYDSDLFPPLDTPDTWDSVFVDGVTIEGIIESSYERTTRLAGYDFAAIDPKVWGAIYEQYLGYVAQEAKEEAKKRATQARLLGFEAPVFELEARRIKRKQQGIYYTPEFVVDYIVKETVGRFIKEHSYNDIFNIKILDPACGSGSFLIRAYDELLHYHAHQQGKSPAEIDHSERRRILLGNIFGVDLDRQAVEITRLSLLLRSLAKQEILPPLADNIREGNSLISGTEEELKNYFGDDWQDKKRFNWGQEFKDIMANGGFDVVIGNPPYAGFQGFKDKDYLKEAFETAKGRFDIYIPFIELGLRILKPSGLLSFICPTNFMKRGHGEALRKFCKSQASILEIVDFRDFQIFEEALNYTGILVLKKGPPEDGHKLSYKAESISAPPQEFFQADLDDELWVFPSLAASKVISVIKNMPVEPLEGLCFGISEGIVTGKNEVFITSTDNAQRLGLEERIFRPILQGKDIRRYFLEEPEHTVIYPYKLDNGKTVPIDENELMQKYPNTWNYLNSKRNDLSGRAYFEASKKLWYELWCERNFETLASEKIVVAEIAEANRFALCPDYLFYLDTACGITLKPNFQSRYILGILNSKLMNFFYKNTTVPKANKFFIYKTMFLRHIPIRRIDFNNPTDKKLHDDLVALVDKMLGLNKRLAPIRDTYGYERDELLREIERTDAEIDQKVYELYGLSEEERQVIETSLVSKSSSCSQ